MATETKRTWGTRSKRTSATALGLVAIIAGIAIAYFLTTEPYAGNKAVGGTLTVNTNLPLDFYANPDDPSSPETLYPTNATTGKGNNAAVLRTMEVDNQNSVSVAYSIYAQCNACATDPLAKDQFDNLWISIWTPVAPPSPTSPNLSCPTGSDISVSTTKFTNCPQAHYEGRLADLTATNAASLGTVAADADKDFEVYLWLKNDPTRAQPQNVTSLWEFFVSAKTPTS